MNDPNRSTRISRSAAILLGAGTVLNPAVVAAEPAVDKSAFTVLNPTPAELMRDLSADRPDATESPVTVDAGHIQVELSFFDFTYNSEAGQRTDAWTVMDTNVKLGVTNDIDVQLVFAAYSQERTRMAGVTETVEGFGDVIFRVKLNFWGNDGDAPAGLDGTALGIMPFIKIPTGTALSNDHVEGGIILPFAWDITDTIGIGLMAEVDFVYDEANDEYDIEFLHSAVIGFEVFGPVGAFVEFVGVVPSNGSGYQASFIVGGTIEITPDFMIDAGVRIGVTHTDDVGFFAGMTWRY